MKESVCLNRREIITEDLGKVDFKLKMTLSSLSRMPTHIHTRTCTHTLTLTLHLFHSLYNDRLKLISSKITMATSQLFKHNSPKSQIKSVVLSKLHAHI